MKLGACGEGHPTVIVSWGTKPSNETASPREPVLASQPFLTTERATKSVWFLSSAALQLQWVVSREDPPRGTSGAWRGLEKYRGLFWFTITLLI